MRGRKREKKEKEREREREEVREGVKKDKEGLRVYGDVRQIPLIKLS